MKRGYMKNAIITGGNSGIGFATAKELMNNDVSVTITGRNRYRLEKAANELGCDYFIADMGDTSKLKDLANQFENGLDYLVLNAATVNFNPIENIDLEDFDNYININFKGNYFLIKYLKEALKKREGAVTSVTSAMIHSTAPNMSLYTSCKGAIDSLTRALAVEFADDKIRVNSICCGAVETDLIEKSGIPKEIWIPIEESIKNNCIPMKRFSHPSEIAKVIFSQLNSTYVTGAAWNVDGGVGAI